MFSYAIKNFNYFVQAFEGVHIWTDDADDPGILNRLYIPYYNSPVTPAEKPISEMTCVNHRKDTLSLESYDTANLKSFIINFENPQSIGTIRVINTSDNPLLMGNPEFLDLLEAFVNIKTLHIENCQNVFEGGNEVVICPNLRTLSLVNMPSITLDDLEEIAEFFPKLRTLIFTKCPSINNIDDHLEDMIDLFPHTKIITLEDTTYILDRVKTTEKT